MRGHLDSVCVCALLSPGARGDDKSRFQVGTWAQRCSSLVLLCRTSAGSSQTSACFRTACRVRSHLEPHRMCLVLLMSFQVLGNQQFTNPSHGGVLLFVFHLVLGAAQTRNEVAQLQPSCSRPCEWEQRDS